MLCSVLALFNFVVSVTVGGWLNVGAGVFCAGLAVVNYRLGKSTMRNRAYVRRIESRWSA